MENETFTNKMQRLTKTFSTRDDYMTLTKQLRARVVWNTERWQGINLKQPPRKMQHKIYKPVDYLNGPISRDINTLMYRPPDFDDMQNFARMEHCQLQKRTPNRRDKFDHVDRNRSRSRGVRNERIPIFHNKQLELLKVWRSVHSIPSNSRRRYRAKKVGYVTVQIRSVNLTLSLMIQAAL